MTHSRLLYHYKVNSFQNQYQCLSKSRGEKNRNYFYLFSMNFRSSAAWRIQTIFRFRTIELRIRVTEENENILISDQDQQVKLFVLIMLNGSLHCTYFWSYQNFPQQKIDENRSTIDTLFPLSVGALNQNQNQKRNQMIRCLFLYPKSAISIIFFNFFFLSRTWIFCIYIRRWLPSFYLLSVVSLFFFCFFVSRISKFYLFEKKMLTEK